jgi:glyoxylase-like metal-dependent hydrolase (beta-lactamase superfamily II)
MAKVYNNVYFIPGQDDFIPDSHVYIIGNPESKDLSLVDVGLMGKGSYKIESIKKMGIDLSSIKRIIMTHTHLDHIGCFAEIKKSIPDVELWVQVSLPLNRATFTGSMLGGGSFDIVGRTTMRREGLDSADEDSP